MKVWVVIESDIAQRPHKVFDSESKANELVEQMRMFSVVLGLSDGGRVK